jgi:tetratricopeptide (TPR) repeat protein
MFYSEQGEYEIAINYLTKALLLFHRYDGPEWKAAVANTQIVFGSVYQQQGDIDTALSYYLLAEETSSGNNDYSSLHNVLSKIRDCYLNLNQFDKAAIYAAKNLKLAENRVTL